MNTQIPDSVRQTAEKLYSKVNGNTYPRQIVEDEISQLIMEHDAKARELLTELRDVFDHYANLHYQKHTTAGDIEGAENRGYAYRIQTFLATNLDKKEGESKRCCPKCESEDYYFCDEANWNQCKKCGHTFNNPRFTAPEPTLSEACDLLKEHHQWQLNQGVQNETLNGLDMGAEYADSSFYEKTDTFLSRVEASK